MVGSAGAWGGWAWLLLRLVGLLPGWGRPQGWEGLTLTHLHLHMISICMPLPGSPGLLSPSIHPAPTHTHWCSHTCTLVCAGAHMCVHGLPPAHTFMSVPHTGMPVHTRTHALLHAPLHVPPQQSLWSPWEDSPLAQTLGPAHHS